jgi:hypothetical protein
VVIWWSSVVRNEAENRQASTKSTIFVEKRWHHQIEAPKKSLLYHLFLITFTFYPIFDFIFSTIIGWKLPMCNTIKVEKEDYEFPQLFAVNRGNINRSNRVLKNTKQIRSVSIRGKFLLSASKLVIQVA